jgi:hypothetical protein
MSVRRCASQDSAALYDLWRFLNLLHVTAYCGVTATYNKANLCDEFCAQHGLLSDPAVRERLEAMDIESPQAWSMCLVWALEVVHQRAEAKDFASPIHKEMVEHITTAGAALSRIYAQEYQARADMPSQTSSHRRSERSSIGSISSTTTTITTITTTITTITTTSAASVAATPSAATRPPCARPIGRCSLTSTRTSCPPRARSS